MKSLNPAGASANPSALLSASPMFHTVWPFAAAAQHVAAMHTAAAKKRFSIMNKMSIDDLNRRVKCINFEEDLNTELGILVPKTKTCPITWRLIRFINGLFNE